MSSTVLAGVMVFSMGMSAWATTTDALEEVTSTEFTKAITTDGHTYAPNTKFEFVIKNGEAVKEKDIKAGVEGGLTVNYRNITFDPATDTFSNNGYSKKGELSVVVTNDTFQAPGVYHYTIKETIPETSYSGIEYDKRVYDVYVTILNTAKNDGLYCAGIRTPKLDDDGNPVLDSEGKMVKADSLVFTNDYGAANDSTHDVTIAKKVTGNQADMNQAFDFVIIVNADKTGEIFKYEKNDAAITTGSIAGDGKSEVTVSLMNGEAVTIYGLTDGDVVDVHEKDIYASAEYGYKVTREFTEGVEMVDGNEDTNGFIAKITKDSSKVEIENNKNVGAATGLALTFGPYVLMVGLAGVFAVMFLRKKNGIDEI